LYDVFWVCFRIICLNVVATDIVFLFCAPYTYSHLQDEQRVSDEFMSVLEKYTV
jgi:hypothetical protein